MTKPNNFGTIYKEFVSDEQIRYKVFNKETGQVYFESYSDTVTLEGVRQTLRGQIFELTELNDKGKPFYIVKKKNTKKNKALLMIAEALKLRHPVYIKTTERF
jgi:hypothetical protein